MTLDSKEPTELETAIVAVYRGPLEEFVNRRSALAKQLRGSKRRDDADRVKGLRKPSRTAWALDQIVFEDPAPVEQLASAITAAQEAQSSAGGTGRTALESLRAAVRAVADAGARAALRAGHPIESTSLVAAVRAVIGDARAFADLRAGRLTEVPEGGGLDILTAVAFAGPSPETAGSGPEPETPDADVAALRADLLRAEGSLAAALERARAAERAVVSARAELEAAEQQLHRAQQQAGARRLELERARQDADTAAAQVADAEGALAEIRARIG